MAAANSGRPSSAKWIWTNDGITAPARLKKKKKKKKIFFFFFFFFFWRGFNVRTYTDGESALQGMTAKPVDLAVLDIKMPRMDGMELLQRLRPAAPCR